MEVGENPGHSLQSITKQTSCMESGPQRENEIISINNLRFCDLVCHSLSMFCYH